MLAANPHLKDLTKVPTGTTIVIADLPDNPSVSAPQTAGVSAELDGHLKVALKESAGVIGRSMDTRETAVNATLEALKSRELRDFAAQTPELKEQLDTISHQRGTVGPSAETFWRALAVREVFVEVGTFGRLRIRRP